MCWRLVMPSLLQASAFEPETGTLPGLVLGTRLFLSQCLARDGQRTQTPSRRESDSRNVELGGHSFPWERWAPPRLWKRISLAIGPKMSLAERYVYGTALQERRVKQHLKEKTITVKYEKKTKPESPGTCQALPYPPVVRITRRLSQALEQPWN